MNRNVSADIQYRAKTLKYLGELAEDMISYNYGPTDSIEVDLAMRDIRNACFRIERALLPDQQLPLPDGVAIPSGLRELPDTIYVNDKDGETVYKPEKELENETVKAGERVLEPDRNEKKRYKPKHDFTAYEGDPDPAQDAGQPEIEGEVRADKLLDADGNEIPDDDLPF